MARATREDGIVQPDELQKGMKIFTVINATIKDSLGAYCTTGQQAALNKADATRYHKLKAIQVDLPDFDDPNPAVPTVPPQEPADDDSKPAASTGAEAAAATGAAGGENQPEPAADSAGTRTSRRV